MSDDRWQRGWDVFHDALALDEPARAAFVDAACAGDPELLAEVTSLLSAHGEDPAFLAGPAVVDLPGAFTAALVGSRIGPYVVRRILGEGGMGIVCDAEQDGDVRRRVALKLIRAGMETGEIVARFSAERQALALMTHPNIATAYDVGITDEGRPYFAMEFVDGSPVTEFCDERRLPIGDRIALFLQVCDAVQHAHQKGIIHRDLKPSNVLVAVVDGRPTPKVIDFGVAKAIGRRLTDRSLHTAAGRMIGTPEYMSPEQAGLSGLDVDTRADIYSLGVMFFELLVGALPVDSTMVRTAGFSELERVLFGGDPPKPSHRFGGMGDARESAARNRGTRPSTLARDLRGDLDWIAVKAMERDRSRRYASASELGADLARHLAGEPVMAGPPTAGYRLRKFVTRHKAGVATAAAFLVLTVAFAVSTAIHSARTTRALGLAETERERAEQISAFLVDLFKVSNPGEARGSAVTAREVLDAGAAKMTDGLKDQPEQRARMLDTIGQVYTNLGVYPRAQAMLEEALVLYRGRFSGDRPEIAVTLTRLGNVLWWRAQYRPALERYREALAMRRRIHGGDGHADVAESLTHVGRALRSLGELAPAKQAFEESLAIKIEVLPADDQSTASTLQNLGSLSRALNDLPGAEAYLRRSLEMNRRLHGDTHVDTGRSKNDLAAVLHDRGDDAGAEVLYRDALATHRAVFGNEHPEVASALNNYGTVLRRMRRYADAEEVYRQALAIRRVRFGDAHPEVAVALSNMGGVLKDKGDLDGAESRFRQALDIFRAALGEKHANVATVLHNLGEVLHDKGDPRAEATIRDALARKQAALPAGHASIAMSLSLAGQIRSDRGDPAGAEPMLRDALAALRKSFPDTHPRVAEARSRLGSCLVALGRRQEAEPLLRESLTVLRVSGAPAQERRVEKLLAGIPR